MWQKYSPKVSPSNTAELDFQVGCRALAAGCSQKEIALMLVAGSPTVQRIMQENRKEAAIQYVNRVAQLSCQRQSGLAKLKMSRHKPMELGD